MINPSELQERDEIYHLSLSQGTRDYLAGVVSGLGKVFAGHPFDTIKVRVQSGNYRNSWDALKTTVRMEGLLSLYQGMLPPLCMVCFVGGVLFYFNGRIRTLIQPDPTIPLTYSQMFLAGGGAGLVVGLVVTPPEVVKLHLQVINRKVEVKPPMHDLIRRIGPMNLFAGCTPTLIREVGTFGLFFPLNEYFKRRLGAYQNKDPSNLSIPSRILAAGTGGILCWLPCYPIDQIKSRMQLRGAHYYTGMVDCALDIYRTEGVRRGFFKGLSPCLTRAFPAYAAQFILYEQVAGWLNRYCL
jgi:solute carrier family 25 carnitine/acylcarnitine transporter 20/29